MRFPRASGILLHPTSLPGGHGIGDLGPEAYSFINFLEDAEQTYWQILPLGPTGHGNSPYQCYSAFAGNTLLISLEKLAEDRLLRAEQLSEHNGQEPETVDFESVRKLKVQMLSLAFETFRSGANAGLEDSFGTFKNENAWWLDDYALFRAIKAADGETPWYEWPEPLKARDPAVLYTFSQGHAELLLAEKFYQFIFFRQWRLLKEYAGKHGVKIIGDIPIFVALDSADVWCNQDKFKLKPTGLPRVVAGVPPDHYSKTGQLWGNPIYDWERMQEDGFKWWAARVEFALRMTDVVRIDHFRGFSAAWEVPGGDETAENGSWVAVPGKELFLSLQRDLGRLPVIAEDLGEITPEVLALRDTFGFPGMKILQFAFGGDAKNIHLPHNFFQNSVAYTGTHDNDTAVGWWRSLADAGAARDHAARTGEHCMKYLKTDGNEIHWDLIRAVWASVADTAIAPAQDLLGLGSVARMNLPATKTGNWSWRMARGALTPKIAKRLRELTELYGRC